MTFDNLARKTTNPEDELNGSIQHPSDPNMTYKKGMWDASNTDSSTKDKNRIMRSSDTINSMRMQDEINRYLEL